MNIVDHILGRLADSISQGGFVELETEGVELMPVPASGGDRKELYKSVNAFLNTRGGVVILGVKEEGSGASRRYILGGWNEDAEQKLKEVPRRFADGKGTRLDLSGSFPPMEIRPLLNARVVVLYVDELAADEKFAHLNGVAYKRILTGDHKISERDVEAQEEFKEEAAHARELQPVPGMTEADLDLTKLNDFIFHLNRPQQIETLKPDIAAARAFLERRSFLRDGAVTMLGALVCANHPGDRLGFRCHVHGYVDHPSRIAQDKQDFVDNVLKLMELSLGYLLRNIQVGVSAADGGVAIPQYPEEILLETVNNALAHRDYSVDKQVIIAVSPGRHIAIQNPGRFRRGLIIDDANAEIPVRRILPEAKPRNPKLADVLRVYRKWEGRGIGMTTLVNLCLENRIDLPYYRLYTEEVRLHVCAGKLLDERMERLFESFDRHLATRLGGGGLSVEQKLVLAYLIKSEWANEQARYTILLTPDNNHFAALARLESAGLISRHVVSTAAYPVYVADRVLVQKSHSRELRNLFGEAFDGLDEVAQETLGVVYRHNHFCSVRQVSAKQAAFALWHARGGAEGGIRQFDALYRKVRSIFNKIEKAGFVQKVEGTRGYVLREDFRATHLL